MTRFAPIVAFSILAIVAAGSELSAEPVAVSKSEGIVHGFLSLRSLEGDLLATGDLIQVPNQERIESPLVFHFLDGSTHDERVVFSQKKVFRLETIISCKKVPRFTTAQRTEKTRERPRVRSSFPSDVYNGMFFTLLKSLDAHIPEEAKRKVTMVVFTPDPRMVSIEISSQGEDPFRIETSPRRPCTMC